jgi:tetratricopeptide (TPR) repeat protein
MLFRRINNKKMKIKQPIYTLSIYTILLVAISASSVLGQKDRISESEVNIQKIFIEANKEKLLGNDEDAIILFAEVIRKQPTNGAAAYELAKLYNKTGDKSKAISYAQKAVENEPNNIWFITYYAEMLSEKGDHDAAATLYQNLTVQFPTQYDYYFEWAYMLIKAAKMDEAIEVYDELENKTGVNEKTTKRKYSLYLAIGKNKKAEAELQKLINAFPSEVSYYQLLAEYYDQQGEKEKAKAIYQKMLIINPDDAVANLALAETFKDSGNEEKYLTSMQELFKNPEVNIDMKISELAPYIKKMPFYKNKTVVRSKILELGEILTVTHSKDAKAFSVYGDLLYHAEENTKALEAYKNTLKLDQNVFMVWEQVMYIQADMNDANGLIKSTEEAMDLFPNQALVYYMSGRAYAIKKNHAASVDALEQALMMSRRDNAMRSKVYVQLGAEYHYLKEYAKSNQAFEDALAINSRDAEALNSYSFFLCERNENLDKARQMSSSANQLVENKPKFLDTYGWILYKSEDYEAAERWLKKAIDFGGTDNPTILEHYGDVLFQLGKESEAVQYWQKAQTLGSDSTLLDKKIQDRKLYK